MRALFGLSVDWLDSTRGVKVMEESRRLNGVGSDSSGTKVISSGQVVRHIDRLAWSENSESLGVAALNGSFEAIFELRPDVLVSCAYKRRTMIPNLGTNELRRARVGSDGKCIGVGRRENTTRVIEKLQSLVASVEDGSDDGEIVDVVNLGWTGDLE